MSLVIKKNTVDNDDYKDDETDNDDDGTVDDGGGKSAVYADGRYQAFEEPAKESKWCHEVHRRAISTKVQYTTLKHMQFNNAQ